MSISADMFETLFNSYSSICLRLKSRASNPRPAGQKWPAKGFKMAHERFLRWLVDWCLRADVVICRKKPQNPFFKTFFLVFTCFLAENTDQILAKTFFFFFLVFTYKFWLAKLLEQQIWPAAEKGWTPLT